MRGERAPEVVMDRVLCSAWASLAVVSACLLGQGCGTSNVDGGGASSGGASSSGASSGASSGSSGTPDGGKPGRAYPLKLSALSTPQTSTANITVFFSAVDANGEGVNDLSREEFRYFEDGQELSLDASEYDFTPKPLTGQSVNIPSVLVLDLSQSVVDAGALEIVKKTANAIIDGMLPEQTLAILSFADSVKQRSPMTSDKTALKAAINAITQADGASTNLFGAVKQAVGMWTDGFVGTSTTGQLTAGLAVVISDGDDTAGAVTQTDMLKTRGNKRVVTVGVGKTDATVLSEISRTGLYLPFSDFGSLEKSVGSLTKKLSNLNQSIYLASYCSPKRAGEHSVVFTVKGNPTTATTSCKPAVFTPGLTCNIPGKPQATELCGGSGQSYTCCPGSAPFACASTDKCYATAEQAEAACGTSCVNCGGTGQANDSRVEDGNRIRISFTAVGYQSTQCPKFRGPECKALDACCASLPKTLRAQCETQAAGSGGNESSCTPTKQQFCPARGPECTKQTVCCKTFGDTLASSCWQQATNETSCTQYNATYCDGVGPACTALRTCCAAKTLEARQQCDNYYVSARGSSLDDSVREASCSSNSAAAGCP